MILLVAFWVLLVQPVPPAGAPEMKEFTVETVEFGAFEDCVAAGRRCADELADAAYAPQHRLQWGAQRPRYAPAGAAVTFTCVERSR